MAKVERARDRVFGEPVAGLLERRAAEGWKMAAIEWERELTSKTNEDESFEPVPFGLRVARDCRHLEVDPTESEILILVMEMVVHERDLFSIAEELSKRGYVTRENERWTPAAVFNLMPRLIESGARIFSTPGWPARRGTAVG